MTNFDNFANSEAIKTLNGRDQGKACKRREIGSHLLVFIYKIYLHEIFISLTIYRSYRYVFTCMMDRLKIKWNAGITIETK